MTNQYKKSHILTVRIDGIQNDSLNILKSYNVDISKFIRQSIKEKIQRDWKIIKQPKEEKTPF